MLCGRYSWQWDRTLAMTEFSMIMENQGTVDIKKLQFHSYPVLSDLYMLHNNAVP